MGGAGVSLPMTSLKPVLSVVLTSCRRFLFSDVGSGGRKGGGSFPTRTRYDITEPNEENKEKAETAATGSDRTYESRAMESGPGFAVSNIAESAHGEVSSRGRTTEVPLELAVSLTLSLLPSRSIH